MAEAATGDGVLLTVVAQLSAQLAEMQVLLKQKDEQLAARDAQLSNQLGELNARLASKEVPAGPDPLLDEVIATYKRTGLQEVARETARVVSCRLGTIRQSVISGRLLGSFRVSQLSPLVLDEYRVQRHRLVSESSVAAEVLRFRVLLRWAKKRRLISVDPLADADTSERIRTRQTVYLPETVQAIVAWMRHRADARDEEGPGMALGYREAAAVVLTMAGTGIRPVELYRLRVGQLQRDSRDLTIEAKQSKGGYGGRTVRLSTEAHAALLELAGERPSDAPLFVRTYHAFADNWRAACKALGVKGADGEKPDAYSLRHSFASTAAERSPVFAVMKAMGHSQITTTQRYVKVSSAAVAEVFEKVQATSPKGETHDEHE